MLNFSPNLPEIAPELSLIFHFRFQLSLNLVYLKKHWEEPQPGTRFNELDTPTTTHFLEDLEKIQQKKCSPKSIFHSQRIEPRKDQNFRTARAAITKTISKLAFIKFPIKIKDSWKTF